jgi:hypothetical protein
MKQNWAVLSQGRSASVLLALRIAKHAQILPLYDKDFTQPSDLVEPHVLHSHVLWQKNQLTNYVRVFNLRRNPVETILSRILANHHRQYHKRHDDTLNFESIEFTDWQTVDKYCNQYKGWLQWYTQQLETGDVVVFYEDIIQRLSNLNDYYLPIYLNKPQLLLNHDQIANLVTQQNLTEFQQSFLKHQNSFDLLELINQ